jgi:hypothetical protein
MKSGSSTLPQTPSPLKHDSPTKDTGKKRKRDDEDNEDDEDDRHDITVQSLVQQVTSNTMSALIWCLHQQDSTVTLVRSFNIRTVDMRYPLDRGLRVRCYLHFLLITELTGTVRRYP